MSKTVILSIAASAILVSILGPANLAAQSNEPIAEITIGAEPDYPPYSFVDVRGRPSGFSVDLFRAAAEAMDIKVEIRVDLWDTIRGDLAAGRLDALPLVGRTPEREELFDFTFPYLSLLGGIVVADGNESINTLADLRGRRVAVMSGDNAHEFLLRNGFDVEIITVPAFSDAIRLVAAGESDAVVMQRLVAMQLIADENIAGVRVLNQPLREFRQDFAFAVTEGNSTLLSQLNEGLALVIEDGTLRRLQMMWLAPTTRPTQTIVVGGRRDNPPFEFIDEDGRPAGYNVELVRSIADELGLDVEIRLGPWFDIVDMLNRGDVDVIASMPYSVGRDREFDFSPSHTINRVAVIGRPGLTSSVPDSITGLGGARLAVPRDDLIYPATTRARGEDNLTVVDTPMQAMELVRSGDVDYALVDRLTAFYLIAQNGWVDLVVNGRVAVAYGESGFAVRAGEDQLRSLLSDGLTMIEDNGRYQSIYDEWLGLDSPASIRAREVLRYSIFVLVPLVAVLLATILWNRLLRSQVARRTVELRESERLFRLLSENTADAVWLATPELRMRYVNPAIESLTGHSPEQWIGTRLRDHFDGAEFRALLSGASLAAHDNEPANEFRVETQFGRETGSPVVVEVVGRALYSPTGRLDGYQGVARDITDRKRFESALRESARQQRWLTSMATSYLERRDERPLIPASIEQLALHFDRLHVSCVSLDENGVLRENYRAGGPEDRAVAPIDLALAPELLAALEAPAATVRVINPQTDPVAVPVAKSFAAWDIASMAIATLPIQDGPRVMLTLSAPRAVKWSEHTLLSLEEHANLLRLIIQNESYRRMMADARRELEDSLAEKQTLLQEVHHRVKNNLNVVISLLRLQEDRIDSVQSARDALETSRNRIYAMALVHESLYRSPNLGEIDLSEYLRTLSHQLADSLNADRPIKLSLDVEPVNLDISRAIPCGIIVNELVTNASKHAFAGRTSGEITISLHRADGVLELAISDNGIGMGNDELSRESSSLGLTLVRVLAGQIEAELAFENRGGTTVTLGIPNVDG